MFAVGHIALGYIIGKILNKASEQNLNIPAIWLLSLLPDIDLLIPGLEHRGPTHSLIVALIIFAPLFIIDARKTAPYLAALAIHSLIGDFITGRGVQLLWPVSSEWMTFRSTMRLGTKFEAYVELTLFVVLIVTLILSKDFKQIFNSDRENGLLFIPLCTIVLPVMFKYPVKIPKILVIPHLILMSIIALSFIVSFAREAL